MDLVDREGPGLRRRRERQVPGRGRPRRAQQGHGEVLAREARGDGRRERRGAHGGVLREGHADAGASSRGACGRRWWPGRSSPCCPPRPSQNAGVHAAPRRDRGPAPSPADRGEVTGTDPATKAETSRKPAADAPLSAFVFKTHRRPPRRPHLALPRLLGHAQGRLGGAQLEPRRGGARGLAAAAPGQGPDPGPGDPGRRHRRGGQAQGDADGRHARRQGRPRSSTRRSSSRSRPLPSPSSPRPAATRTRSRPRCSACRRRTRSCASPRRADPRDAALGHGPAPRRGGGRPPAQALQGRGQPQEAQDPLPGDDQGRGRGPRPAQEADRRPRAVRRLQDPDEAAGARRGLRVRGRHLRRLDPAGTSSPPWRRASRTPA